MLNRLGIKRLAYDYRAEHIATFDEEMVQLKKHGIELVAWWFPSQLNEEAKTILWCPRAASDQDSALGDRGRESDSEC